MLTQQNVGQKKSDTLTNNGNPKLNYLT